MGAWGTGNFENDSVLDWVCGLEPPKTKMFGLKKINPFKYCFQPVNEVLNAKGWIDSEDCMCTLASGECIAALRGSPLEDLPEEVVDWIGTVRGLEVSTEEMQRLVEAVKRVRNDEKSELRQLWTEAQDNGEPDPQWIAAADDLIQRLGG